MARLEKSKPISPMNLVLLIFFGAKKIPDLARGLGKGIREFKDATKEIKDEIEDGVKDVKDIK